jgi:hypothetical protein
MRHDLFLFGIRQVDGLSGVWCKISADMLSNDAEIGQLR